MLNFGISLSMTENPVYEDRAEQQEKTMDVSKHALSTSEETSLCSKGSSSPRTPDYNRAKCSYRSSYPPSNRELQDYAEAMKKSTEDGIPPQQSSGSNFRESTDNHPRPRRSSLRQPGACRRDSTSLKQVRFDTEDRVYEPFTRPDSQIIEQIFSLMRLDRRSMLPPSIPRRAQHAVSNDSIAAAHEYSEPVSPTGDVPPTVGSKHAKAVGGYRRNSDSRCYQSRGSSFEQLEKRRSRLDVDDGRRSCEDLEYCSEVRSPLRSPLCLGAASQLRSPPPVEMRSSPVRVPSLSEARPQPRLTSQALAEHDHYWELQSPSRATGKQRKDYSSSHCETLSRRQAMPCADSRSRPRASTIPHPSGLNRSSSESEETVVTPEMTWAPAGIMLAKPPTQAPPLEENEPISVSPKEGGRLRRKDAQSLPAVPRRNKFLQNIARIFE